MNQFGLVIFGFIILFCQILCHFLINNYNNHIGGQNNALMTFRNYYGVFNTLLTYIFSLACLADGSREEKCHSTIGLFENHYNSLKNKDDLNLTEFISNLNKYLSNEMSKIKQNITEILSNTEDQDLINLVNSKMPIYYINQYFFQNEIQIKYNIQNITFLEVLDYMTNGFLIMSNYHNLNETVYILNNINPNNINLSPFIHIKSNKLLTQYQINFYFFVSNFQSFLSRLEIITLRLLIKTGVLGSSNIKYSFIYISVNFLLYLLIYLFLFIFIKNYYKIIADLLDEIEYKMNLKNDNISVKEMFLQKITKLQIMISLYKQNIYQAIVDLNFIYDNYKKFIEEKNKEVMKYLKKDKYLNESNNKIVKTIKNNLKRIKIKHIIDVPENKRHLYYLIISFIFSLVLSLILLIMWISYLSVYNKINLLIKAHGNISNNAYKLINYFQLMIFHNYTVEDINRFERYNQSIGEDLFSKIYTDIQGLYESKKIMNKLSQYNLGNIDSYYNYTCETYYNYLYNSNIVLKNTNIKYKEFLMYVCESSNIFKSNNYKQIFSILFEYFQIGINTINDHSYNGLIKIFQSSYFSKVILFFITVYIYAFEILGAQLQRKSYQKINSIMVKYVNIQFLIYYTTSFALILIIIFVYTWKINTKYNKINEIKKIFKVCNKNG